ncbi:MAG: GatB/YqeY domain-containing protein [Paludibacteraceae bacterium]|nr:GatB/YqeY domain-containing protein [Paludibacteraceae bacterium]
MELIEQITEDIKKAMLAKDKVRLDTLRGIKKELLEAKTAKGADGSVSEDTGLKIMQKMVKQRKESAAIYEGMGRQDMAESELAQAAVIEEYLPKPLSDEELTAAIQAIIAETGAKTPQEMGKVMGVASKRLAGKVEGRVLSEKVKSLLNQ